MRVIRYVVEAAVLFAASRPALRGQTLDAGQVLAAARGALGGEQKLTAVKTFVAIGRTRQIRGNNWSRLSSKSTANFLTVSCAETMRISTPVRCYRHSTAVWSAGSERHRGGLSKDGASR
jgi:hypothetical protein